MIQEAGYTKNVYDEEIKSMVMIYCWLTFPVVLGSEGTGYTLSQIGLFDLT